MIRLGLTGGIASGKTTVGRMFARQGAVTYNADAAVHHLLARSGPVRQWVMQRFPATVIEGRIDRRTLGSIVFDDRAARLELEAVLHPAVTVWEKRLAERYERQGRRVMVSDIPLLFEVGAETRYAATMVVSCPAPLQRFRALRREGMTEEKYRRIVALQMPLAQKRRLADWEIFTGLGPAITMQAVKEIMAYYAA